LICDEIVPRDGREKAQPPHRGEEQRELLRLDGESVLIGYLELPPLALSLEEGAGFLRFLERRISFFERAGILLPEEAVDDEVGEGIGVPEGL
jgi:hypothetical protein